MTLARSEGRSIADVRPATIEIGYQPYPEGSALIKTGNTHVLCSATVGNGVPGWRRGKNLGWVTAEYGMLPRSTHTRTRREARAGKQGGRSLEIQRLIDRSLRAVIDMEALGERTITVDCDVLRADGGTRTAAITGGYVALHVATQKLVAEGKIEKSPILEAVAALSVGLVQGEMCLDLAYDEDSVADVDLNVVMTTSGNFVEVQGTAERRPFSREQLDQLLDLSATGMTGLFAAPQAALESS